MIKNRVLNKIKSHIQYYSMKHVKLDYCLKTYLKNLGPLALYVINNLHLLNSVLFHQSIKNTQAVLYLINNILVQLLHPLFMQKYNHFLWFSDNIHIYWKANISLFSKLVLNHVTHRVIAQGQLNIHPSNLLTISSDPKALNKISNLHNNKLYCIARFRTGILLKNQLYVPPPPKKNDNLHKGMSM